LIEHHACHGEVATNETLLTVVFGKREGKWVMAARVPQHFKRRIDG